MDVPPVLGVIARQRSARREVRSIASCERISDYRFLNLDWTIAAVFRGSGEGFDKRKQRGLSTKSVTGAAASLYYTSSERPGACPLEFHARFYIGSFSKSPAFVRLAPQAAAGGLRGEADAGARPAFDVETNVKRGTHVVGRGTSPWPVFRADLCSTTRAAAWSRPFRATVFLSG